MRFLIVTLDAGGNQPPAVAIGRELQKQGHSVRVLGNTSQRALFQNAGLTFRVFERTPEPPVEKVTPERVRLRMTQMETAYDVQAEVVRDPVDVVLVDCLLLSGLVGAEASGAKTAVLAHTLYAMVDPFSRKLANALGAVREAFSLQPLQTDQSPYVRSDSILVTTLPEMEPPGIQALPQVCWVGPIFNDVIEQTLNLPELNQDGRPWVLAGFSTAIIDGATDTMQRVLNALAPLDVRVLVSLTGINQTVITPPPNAVLLPYVPHLEVMDKMSLVITHAGHGTVMSALSHGVPMVCLPMVNDEPLVAERVASLGAGITVSPSADEQSIRAAILKVLHEPDYQSAAEHLGLLMGNGALRAAEQLERLNKVFSTVYTR